MASSLSRFSKAFLVAVACTPMATAQNDSGFDRNEYPGDTTMASLRKSFVYSSYWLNPPPGMHQNGWAGKRMLMREMGFGFLLLWNGRLAAELTGKAAALGEQDGQAAVTSARREGFPAGAIVFLDQEEGGRLTAAQAAYIGSWIRVVTASAYKPGVYASGIDVPDDPGRTISTTRDLHLRFPDLHLWVANDQCPPAPGCVAISRPPSGSGIQAAEVWQYAQSPGRPQFTSACRQTYAPDGNCYAPGHGPGQPGPAVFLDLNTASSPDPSHGR